MMIVANRYIGIKVLAWFLEHPTTMVYINSLARILNISPASAKQFLDEYAQEGILITEPSEIPGNLLLTTMISSYPP